MTDAETWTIGRLLSWTANYLKQHGADTPRLDAEVLLAHARSCPRIDLYTSFDTIADDDLRNRFRGLVQQRAAGTPVAYLVGRREFYSRQFEVSPAVLIPRPETEFVLIALLDLVKTRPTAATPLKIVDVGTGSGNLAICAALELAAAEILALDVSPGALEIARRNAQHHGVVDRIEFQQSDLFTEVAASRRFDYIIANPPYIGLAEQASLPPDVVGHEPHEALFAGEQGLDVLERLIAAAAERLAPGGWLLSEFSPPQADDLRRFVARHAQLTTPSFADDLTRRPRVLRTQRQGIVRSRGLVG